MTDHGPRRARHRGHTQIPGARIIVAHYHERQPESGTLRRHRVEGQWLRAERRPQLVKPWAPGERSADYFRADRVAEPTRKFVAESSADQRHRGFTGAHRSPSSGFG